MDRAYMRYAWFEVCGEIQGTVPSLERTCTLVFCRISGGTNRKGSGRSWTVYDNLTAMKAGGVCWGDIFVEHIATRLHPTAKTSSGGLVNFGSRRAPSRLPV